MKKKWIIRSLVLLGIVGGIVFWYAKKSKGKNSGSSIKWERPIKTNIVKRITTTGTIVPKKEVEIKSQMSGIVDEIFVSVGQQVHKGDPLLKIRLVPDLENLNNAESNVKVAKINVDDALTELNRQQKLFEVGAIAETDLIKYKKDYKIKNEELQSAMNRLQLIKEGVAKEFTQSSNMIVATCDGMVLDVMTKEGRSIMGRSSFSEGTSLISIADMNQLVFQGKIAESDVDKLSKGMEIDIVIGAIEKEKFKAIVELISPKGKDDQGAIKFDFTAKVIPVPGKMIRAGYSANASIVLEKRDMVLAIKESNIIFENDSSFVKIKQPDGTGKKQAVITGLSDGINIEIIKGVTLKDEVQPVMQIMDNVTVNL